MRPTRALTVVALTTLVGCTSPQVPASTPTLQSEVLRVFATTSTSALVHDLTTAYNETQPLIQFTTRSGNYQAMLDQLLSGEMPYFLSHYLPADSPLWAAPIARDGLAVIVHGSLNLDGLSLDQLRDIYQGRLTHWDTLESPAQEIMVFSRESGSGSRAEFERLVMGSRALTANARIAPSGSSMIDSIAANPGSIGYVATSLLQTGDDPAIRSLEIDGIAATRDTVAAATYPLRSTIYVVGIAEPEATYRAFIAWMQGPQGQAVIARHYVPLFDSGGE